MKKCIIIGAGDFTVPKCINPGDLVIAADGGYDHAVAAGIKPDLFLGDKDSLVGELAEGIENLIFPTHKDYTDMQLAYLEGKRRGYTSFELYGGTGGERTDHTIANIQLLAAIADDGSEAKMISSREVFLLTDKKIVLTGDAGKYISVFAVGGSAEGVKLHGLEYEIDSASLTPDFPLGVSNKFTEHPAEISTEKGKLLIIYQK